MLTCPVRISLATRMALSSSPDQTPPDRPYSESLANSMASSSVEYVVMESTGPKISSRNMVISGVTSANTVGRTKKPLSKLSGIPNPPATRVAPSSIPAAIYDETLSCCRLDTNGPQRFDSSIGSPTEYLVIFEEITSITS